MALLNLKPEIERIEHINVEFKEIFDMYNNICIIHTDGLKLSTHTGCSDFDMLSAYSETTKLKQLRTDIKDLIELFEDYNHPAADIKLINTLTNESTPYQLKTTDYLSYIEKHNDKYPNIPLFVNEEMAKLDPTFESTGLSNSGVTNTVKNTLKGVADEPLDFGVASSMSVAAMITLARNIKVLLKGRNMTSDEKSKLIKDGYIAAGVAGIISLLIG